MTRRDRRRSCMVAAAAILFAGLVAASCSPAARYRALSAVFDGVPPPPGMPKTSVPALPADDAAKSALRDGLEQLRGEKPARAPLPAIVSVHKPVAERQCRDCHDMAKPDAGLSHDATLCDRCHLDQRQREGWDHGPINLGTCIPCHVPHRSVHEHLLSAAMPALCLNCHDGVSADSPDYHRVANFEDCTACHDPHRMY